jgi:hypothetical protein
MTLPLLLIVLGLVLALFVNWVLGIILILAGIVWALWPQISSGAGPRTGLRR